MLFRYDIMPLPLFLGFVSAYIQNPIVPKSLSCYLLPLESYTQGVPDVSILCEMHIRLRNPHCLSKLQRGISLSPGPASWLVAWEIGVRA